MSRNRTIWIVVAVVIVLILLGWGFGWFGGADPVTDVNEIETVE